jgi:hypothetical protein
MARNYSKKWALFQIKLFLLEKKRGKRAQRCLQRNGEKEDWHQTREAIGLKRSHKWTNIKLCWAITEASSRIHLPQKIQIVPSILCHNLIYFSSANFLPNSN